MRDDEVLVVRDCFFENLISVEEGGGDSGDDCVRVAGFDRVHRVGRRSGAGSGDDFFDRGGGGERSACLCCQ